MNSSKTKRGYSFNNPIHSKPVMDIRLAEGDSVVFAQGEFYTLKGHLMKITPLEWSVEKTTEKEGETDVKGKAVSLA